MEKIREIRKEVKKKEMIWFTADYHLGHENIIKYCNRPFDSVEEMNDVIIRCLRSKVDERDSIYFLGDLSFDIDLAKAFFQEFEFVHFIIGNHDSENVIRLAKRHCLSVSYLKEIKIEGQSITLCHYAMRVWNKKHYDSWQLYGHSHGTLIPLVNQYDVGVDNNNFFPISFEELKKNMVINNDNI